MVRIGIVGIGFMGMNRRWILRPARRCRHFWEILVSANNSLRW